MPYICQLPASIDVYTEISLRKYSRFSDFKSQSWLIIKSIWEMSMFGPRILKDVLGDICKMLTEEIRNDKLFCFLCLRRDTET